MELLGRSLADELRDKKHLPWPEATAALRDAAAGLSAAHAQGLVHRDIKPANLLRSGQGSIKVADFGLVDSPDSARLTATGALLGTPGYMAPEQWRGEKADCRSDVYALGCTYYHLLTGRPPFEGGRHEVMDGHTNRPFPDPRRFAPDLPDAICHVIETACRNNPQLRYPTALEMLAELEAALAPAEVQRPVLSPSPKLRIFISSPGDVAEERVVANNLVRRISDEYANRLWIEPVFWEHEPLLAHDTFQNQIPRPSASEIVVCILWSRLGTRLPPNITRPDGSGYASGTEYEFEDAVEGRKKNGFPDLLVYRKTATPLVSLEDDNALDARRRQKKALDGFVQKWFFHGGDGSLKAAFHTFQNTADFEKVLEHHLRKLIQRRVPAGLGPVNGPIKPSWTKGSPFRGLDVFDFEHAPVFFGRTKAIGDVLNALRGNAAAGRAFALVLGPSGSGKSSLARAGVMPVLTQPGVVEGVGLWRRAVMRPSDSPNDVFKSLAMALLQSDALPELAADGTTPERLARDLRDCPKGVALLIKGGLSQAASACASALKLASQPHARLALLVDQLEELFTLNNLTGPDRGAFIDAISALARCDRVFVLATLRSDFYGRCGDLPELIALKEGSGQYDLLPPTASEIGQMIRQPAFVAGLEFEEDAATGTRLDDVLRDAAAGHPESLPLLEFALERLFAQRDEKRGLLLLKAHEAMGGVEGAISNQAETSFREAGPEAQESFPRLFRKLVTLSVDKDHPPVRLRASRQEIDSDAGSRELADQLIADRLLVADSMVDSEGKRVTVVGLAHEAILKTWPRLRTWIDSENESLKSHAEVSADAKRWNEKQRNPDYLYSGGLPLDRAKKLLESGFLSLEERDFVIASLRKVAQLDFEHSLATGKDMLGIAQHLAEDYPDLHDQVLGLAVTSGTDEVRANAAALLGAEPVAALTPKLVDRVLNDQRDAVRRAAAASLIRLDRGEYFDDIAGRLGRGADTETIRALSNIRVAADAVASPTSFEARFRALRAPLRSRIKLQSRLLRLRRGWPVLLIVLFPAVLLGSSCVGVFMAIPGAFNYSLCQSTASPPSGLLHAIIGCCMWGGTITLFIALHRVMFRTEHGKKSALRPWGALVAGALGGVISSFLIMMVLTLCCDGHGTIAAGLSDTDWHSQWHEFWNDLLWYKRTFWPYMVMGTGLGFGMAGLANALSASRRWCSFTEARSLITGKELLPMLKTITRFALPLAWPILVFILLADLIAFYIFRSAPGALPMPDWINTLQAGLLGGRSHDLELVHQWKMSAWGQGLGLFFDSVAQTVGGFFCIVGMGLGLIVVRCGIQIEARKD
jgi:hypothetical protein